MTDAAEGIYLDYAATTPADPEVAHGIADLLTRQGIFGNPHSTSHRFGQAAHQAVEAARREVAQLIRADDDEIIWTSGATEAINLALKGVMLSPNARGGHLLVSALEHKAVLDTADWLSRHGVEAERLQPGDGGLITPALVRSHLRRDTALVSIMHVNNEVGTITDAAEIASVVHAHGALLHVDAVQSVARLPVDVSLMGADLLSLSGHKIYGPKGVGALYVRRAIRHLVEAQTHGGGQEGGLRSGTTPTHQVTGLGIAARLVRERLHADAARISSMDERLLRWIKQIDGVTLNGDQSARVQGIVSVAFRDVEAESLMLALGDIAVSAGSACTTALVEPSHVLLALGLSESDALSSVRFSPGRHTTAREIDAVGRRLIEAVTALRSIAA
ncbi:MAG: aminotransferase class V-fold PLP-dependent enzyme [Acidobacteria bacterium]|nr:aminotransferase class V-fold PLP-dependent enzyme [Acidobacteriota bacterium]